MISDLDGSNNLSVFFVLDIFSAINDHFAVDKDLLYTRRTLRGFPDGCVVGDGAGIENNDIGKIIGYDFAPLLNTHPARGPAAHFADGIPQPYNIFIPCESTENAWKRTV